MARRSATLLLLVGLLSGGLATAQYGAVPAPVVVTDPAAQSRELAASLDRASTQLEQARTRVQRAETEIEGLEGRRRASESALRSRVRALYRLRRSGLLPFAGGFEAMLGHLGRLERLERIVKTDLRKVAFLKRREDAVREELRAARAELAVAEAQKTALDRQQGLLEQQLGALGYGTVASYTPQLAVAPVPPLPGFGGSAVAEPAIAPPSANGFASLRGRLGMPVPSAVAVRDAVRDDGPGLEFVTAPATAARTVADGRVAYAGTYGSYGRLVIVDHGESFYTVYGGLGRVGVRVGDWVARGASLGEVGPGPHPALFFEVRRGTRTLDPRNWTGL